MCPRILCISRHIVAGTREGLGVLIADGEDSSLLLLVLLVVRVETAHEEVQYVAHCYIAAARQRNALLASSKAVSHRGEVLLQSEFEQGGLLTVFKVFKGEFNCWYSQS